MDEAAQRFAELAGKLDPKVVEATLGAARVEAFSWLASSALWFAAAAAFTFLGHFLLAKSNDDDWSEQWFGVGIMDMAQSGTWTAHQVCRFGWALSPASRCLRCFLA